MRAGAGLNGSMKFLTTCALFLLIVALCLAGADDDLALSAPKIFVPEKEWKEIQAHQHLPGMLFWIRRDVACSMLLLPSLYKLGPPPIR